MKIRLEGGAEIGGFHVVCGVDDFADAFVRFESGHGEMRREGARLGFDPEWHERAIDIGGEFGKNGGSGDAAPESARAVLVGEESHTAEMEFDGLCGANRGESILDRIQLLISYVADELQGDVEIFRSYPARGSGFWLKLCDQFCNCVADLIRQVERNEEAHGYDRLRGKRK